MFDFVYKNTGGADEGEVTTLVEKAAPYRKHLKEVVESYGYDAPEASLNLPPDAEMLRHVEYVASKLQNENLRYVVVVGIGGSNLGTKAVYNALKKEDREREMFFLDTVDAPRAKRIGRMLTDCEDASEFAVCIVSKSGKTTETIANASVLVSSLKEKFENISSRVTCITNVGSPLWELAEEKGFYHLAIPEKVGGRYSVLSPVGLLPLSLCGIDIHALRKGATEMRGKCLSDNTSENPALISAILSFHALQNKKTILNFFIFNSALETVGAWWRQLVGESLGKEKDQDGNIVHAGMTPIVSVGSTDLHSVGQLYLGGPEDKFTTFLSVEDALGDVSVSASASFSDLVPEVKEKNFREVMSAILEGVKTAYGEKNLPFVEIKIPSVTEESVGALLQMKMMEIMYLAELMNVNAFDQPSVESYKSVTRDILHGE